jgi:hypothetical protein
VREDVVYALYLAALQGMQDAPEMEGASVNELFSATLTLTNSFVRILKDRGVKNSVLRSSVEQILLGLRDTPKGLVH